MRGEIMIFHFLQHDPGISYYRHFYIDKFFLQISIKCVKKTYLKTNSSRAWSSSEILRGVNEIFVLLGVTQSVLVIS